MLKRVSIFGVVSLLMIGCGGSGGSYGNGGGGGGGNSTGQAQGAYSGTSSNGYTFETIVLPNDKFYAIYGTVTGQGTSGSSTYTANVTDFFHTGTTNSGSITATYAPGSSLNGTLTENGTNITFTGASLPASTFNFNTQASVSDISGTWTGSLMDGTAATVTISSNGNVGGSSSGCSFSGTVVADSSNKNFFDVSLTFGGSPCSLPNQTASGIGVDYLLSDGVTHQLLAAVTVGTSAGTVFVAQR